MKTALNYLDEAKAANGWKSDYRAAKELHISQPTMSAYRNGRTIPDPDTCAKVAEALGIAPIIVIAAAEAERAGRAGNDEAVGRWRARWERITSAATAAGIGMFLVGESLKHCLLCKKRKIEDLIRADWPTQSIAVEIAPHGHPNAPATIAA